MKKTTKAAQIVTEYEAARDYFYSGDLMRSEDYKILEEYIGGGLNKNGSGYSPEFWAVIGFLMGRRSQKK